MKFIEDMDSETNANKRKRIEEEPEEEKQEKRQRLDNTIEKPDEIINISTALSKAETHTLDNIDDKQTNQTEKDVSYSSVSVTESKTGKENAVFINMPAKSDDCSLPTIESENEDGTIKMTASARSLDSRDDMNDGDVRNSEARCFSTTIAESKNTDESKGRDIQVEKGDLGIESGIEKGGDMKFVTYDAVQENEGSLDNCVEGQIGNNEENGITNKMLISPEVLEESNVQTEQKDIQNSNLEKNECRDSVFTKESETQIIISETSGQEDNALDENRFLYRLLRPDESLNHGIEPKDPNSDTTIDDHVACGSGDGFKSKYISCSKTRTGINRFASFIRRTSRFQLRYIVRIDKTKLGEDCKIYDLTEEPVREKYLQSDPAIRHSRRFDEVLLAPLCEIPVECFTKVATVQHGNRKWDDDA